MIDAEITSNPALLSATLLAGFAFGLIYFSMLRETVDLYGSGRSWVWPMALTLGRIAGAAIVLSFVARFGAGLLLAASLGLLLARSTTLHRARRSG